MVVYMEKHVILADTEDHIASCFAVIQELRPHKVDKQAFIDQILMQQSQGYRLVYLQEDNETAACMGYRVFNTLGWGKILYVDDLITRVKSRKNGFAKILLDFAFEQAKLENCDEVHLDSGHHRFDAHRFYLNTGFKLNCHHFSKVLNG